LLVLGKAGFLSFVDNIDPLLKSLRENPWSLPITIAVFIVGSFTFVVPQFALVGAAVVAFGPWVGSIYALLGTVASSCLHFYIGRRGGSDLVQRYGGNTVNRLSRFIGRNDFVASAIVRNVPVSAAIVVNMVFGASPARFWRFIAGVAVGSVPKIAIVALLGQSMLAAICGAAGLAIGGVLAVVGTSMAIALAARRAVPKDGRADNGEAGQ
jgi:uncharacterized membrane protein YdjX (TVP38/TMEM64 family)